MKDFLIEINIKDIDGNNILSTTDISYFKAIHANRVNKLKGVDVFNDMVDTLVKVEYHKIEKENNG